MKAIPIMFAAAFAAMAASEVRAEAWTIPTTAPAVWKNLDADHQLGGRKISDGYLRGKIVLVDRWGRNCPPCRQLLPRMEEVWSSFKTKPFVLLGGHCAGWGSADEVKELVKENNLTYPIYEDAGLANGEPPFNAIPFLYVVDTTGKVRYMGHDERKATEVVVTLLTDLEVQTKTNEYTRLIDHELTTLPGRAFLRLTEFRKKFPKEGKAYDEQYKVLKADQEVQKLAKLVMFARIAKDYNPKNKKNKVKVTRSKIEMTIKAYESLKTAQNPLVTQEAKNALADLTWALSKF